MHNYYADNKQNNVLENLRFSVFNNHEVKKSVKPIVQIIINNCKQLFWVTYIEMASWIQLQSAQLNNNYQMKQNIYIQINIKMTPIT